MEDTIITLTPAGTQLGVIIFLAATQFIEYRNTGRTGHLVLTAILCLFLPFCLRRLNTAWRNPAA